MNRVYHHFEKWEDWKAGLWSSVDVDQAIHEVMAARLLSNPTDLRDAMVQVTNLWPRSTEQNLSNLSQNRRAWLGQAAVCLRKGVPAVTTKRVWWTLDAGQRDEANQAADSVIDRWEYDQGNQHTFDLRGHDA